MTALETRLRTALDSAPAERSVDDLLDDVRRGARRRRNRRTAVVASGCVLVLAATAGGLVWHGQRADTTDHPARHVQTGPHAVSVDAAGAAYEVVANEGCPTPCSTILKSDGAGGWTRLASISDSAPQSRPFGPVTSLQMAPNGHDGWAWGTRVWTTHDGGRTWDPLDVGPGRLHPWDSNLDISAGPDLTWALLSGPAGGELWRTPSGSDRWTQVRLPRGTGQSIAAVLPDSRIALPVVKGVDEFKRVRRPGKPIELIGRYDVGDGRGPWQRVLVPCVRKDLPLRGADKSILCAPGGHREGAGLLEGPKPPPGVQRFKDIIIDVGSTGATKANPLGLENQLNVTPWRAVLATPDGAIAAQLHLDSFQGVNETAVWGSHVVFLNGDRRVYASDDGGRTWREIGSR